MLRDPDMFTPLTINRDTAVVHLSTGRSALVDLSDWPLICRFTWTIRESTHGPEYAVTTICGNQVTMHRLLLNTRSSFMVDHRDRDGLNNRRRNIRRCNVSQNMVNVVRKNKWGFRGVKQHRSGDRWEAAIRDNGRRTHIGTFKTPEDAARAYDRAAEAMHGEFAVLNFA